MFVLSLSWEIVVLHRLRKLRENPPFWAGCRKKFGAKDIGAPYHLQIRDEAAAQSFVLLKNADGVLPLRAGQQHIAVVGPQSSGQGLFSDYFGDDICFGLHDRYQNNLDCVPTIASQIKDLNHGAVTSNATVRAETPFCRHFTLKPEHLPRQARTNIRRKS
jgi:beta-glucosidase-like glycosyl hydrolase